MRRHLGSQLTMALPESLWNETHANIYVLILVIENLAINLGKDIIGHKPYL